MIQRDIRIVVRGPNDAVLDEAFDEAVRKIRQGFTHGFERDDNEGGTYHFEVKETGFK